MKQIRFRPMQDNDADYRQITAWYQAPSVAAYFKPPIRTVEEAITKYRPRILGQSPIVPLFILAGGTPVGYIQYYPICPADRQGLFAAHFSNPYGIDLFIGQENMQNRGVGREIVRSMAAYLWESRQADVVVLDPITKNERAVHCYLRAGAVKAGLFKETGEPEQTILHILPPKDNT